jgi:hypothetical protein
VGTQEKGADEPETWRKFLVPLLAHNLCQSRECSDGEFFNALKLLNSAISYIYLIPDCF